MKNAAGPDQESSRSPTAVRHNLEQNAQDPKQLLLFDPCAFSGQFGISWDECFEYVQTLPLDNPEEGNMAALFLYKNGEDFLGPLDFGSRFVGEQEAEELRKNLDSNKECLYPFNDMTQIIGETATLNGPK